MTNRVGRYQFSLRPFVERVRLGVIRGSEVSAPHLQQLQRFSEGFRMQNVDVLLQTDVSLVPLEVQELLTKRGLAEDFTRFYRALIFCSHLTAAESGRAVSGFVVDRLSQQPEEHDPFSFSALDYSVLKWDFRDEPRRTIYLNLSGSDGALLGPEQLTRNIAYFLGYFKADGELQLEAGNPGWYELKNLYAEQYRGSHCPAGGTPAPIFTC
jgi:hypothetical protein